MAIFFFLQFAKAKKPFMEQIVTQSVAWWRSINNWQIANYMFVFLQFAIFYQDYLLLQNSVSARWMKAKSPLKILDLCV